MNMGVYYLPCIIIFVSALSSVVLSEDEKSIVYLVSRRLSGDIYDTIAVSNSTVHFICSNDGKGNLTFLVHERKCVNNEELLNFNDCNFIITAIEEPSTPRLALIIDYQNDTKMIVVATPYNYDTDAVVYHRSTDLPVNSTFCHITSLEVYRGKNETTKINHTGFHLNQRGAIEINPPLGYSTEEYTGELYRMNLSCNSSDGGLPETAESGCLFFKLIGITNILNAKFNGIVPGTLENKSNNTPPTTASTSPITLTTNSTPFEVDLSTLITTISTISTIGSDNIFEVGSPLFYIVIGAGSSILILLLIILTILTAMCFLVTTRGKSYILALDDQSGDSSRESSNSQGQGTRVALVESVPQPDPIHSNVVPGHDSVAEIVSENLYAEIGERNASSPSPPPLPPPIVPDDLIDEEEAAIESNYQANVSVPSHLKWASKRISRAADHDLAYLYEGHDTKFELPFYPKQAGGVTDVADSLYDDPTSLSLTPAPVRVQDDHQRL